MREQTLRTMRRIVFTLGAGAVVFAAIALAIRSEGGVEAAGVPACVVGLAALPIAWRVHAAMREKLSPGAGEAERVARFRSATILALAITEGGAIFGCFAYVVSGNAMCFVGPAMHVLACGLLWPTEAKLDAFLEGSPKAES